MSAGALDRRITIMRETATNTASGLTRSWSPLTTVWASRKDISDGERAAAGMMQGSVVSRFVVRSSSVSRGIKPKDRLIEGGLTYNIKGIKEIGRRDKLEITAEAEVDR